MSDKTLQRMSRLHEMASSTDDDAAIYKSITQVVSVVIAEADADARLEEAHAWVHKLQPEGANREWAEERLAKLRQLAENARGDVVARNGSER